MKLLMTLLTTLLLLLSLPVAAQSYTESLLHSFGATTSAGTYPVGGLAIDSSGNLYGTTQQGGSLAGLCDQGGCGTVYKLSPQGVLTTLHTFTAGTDGAMPNAALVIDSRGTLYGTTMFGGLGYGVVFKVTSAGRYSVLHTFGRTVGDGKYPLGPLAVDAAGDVFGVTSDVDLCDAACPLIRTLAADKGFGTIFKIAAAKSAYSILYAFTDSADGAWPTGNVVRDAAGNLYGATSAGGGSGGGTLWKLSPRNVLTTLYDFCQQASCADGTGPTYIRRSATGDLYATVYSVDGNGYGGGVAHLSPQLAESVLYNFCAGVYSCAAGYGPQGSTVLAGSSLYGVTEWGGTAGVGAVYAVGTSGGGAESVLYSFAADGVDGQSPEGGVVEDSAGNLYGTTVGGGAYGGGTVWKLSVQK